MKKESIITLPNPRLRQKSSKIHVVTEDVKKIISDMKSAALDWEDSRPHEISAALAAIQINKLDRIIIVRNEFDDKKDRSFTALINPEIIKKFGNTKEDYEGCLSVIDVYGKVPRYDKIKIKALNENGVEVRIKAEGFLSRVIQHEIDHTNGILFVDHIKQNEDAFYRLDESGELQPINYDEVKRSNILW